MDGIQNENFQKSFQKRANIQANSESPTVGLKNKMDYSNEGDNGNHGNNDDENDDDDEDENYDNDFNKNLGKKIRNNYEHYYKAKSQSHNYGPSNPYLIRPKRFRKKNKKLSSTPKLGSLRGVMRFVGKSQAHAPTGSFGGRMLTRAASKAQNEQKNLNADLDQRVTQSVQPDLAKKPNRKQTSAKPKEKIQLLDSQDTSAQISFCPGK